MGRANTYPSRHVEWVELSTAHVKGGMRGLPLQFVDVTEEIVSRMRQLDVVWELRESTWSLEGIFEERPITVIHMPNPFGPARRA